MPTDSFCILPWVELHLTASGHIKNCCAQVNPLKKNEPVSLVDQFNNSKELIDIRNNFLAKKIPSACHFCLQADATGVSYKTVKSKQWLHKKSEVIHENQTNKRIKIRFLDIRLSNVCNFSCRTCNSNDSSSWSSLDPIVGRNTIKPEEKPDDSVLHQVYEILDDVEEIYFAGGEPLLNKSHYLILEEIIKRNKTNIKITYNTNLSVLSAFGRSVLSLWEKLENVIIYPSIDSIGIHGEYIRTGFDWVNFQKNFSSVKKYIGCLHSVLSVYNSFSIQKLIIWSKENNCSLAIFPAYHPNEIAASVLPQSIRHQAANELLQLIPIYSLNSFQSEQIHLAATFILNNDTSYHLKDFISFNRKIDSHKNTHFLSIFPEHSEWYK